VPPRGRKPKPTHLKIVTGNPGRRPINREEAAPKPEPARPAPPEHLCPEAKEEWSRVAEELYPLGLLTRIDRGALAAYCQAYGRWVRAEKKIAGLIELNPLTDGLMIVTKAGNAIQNPLVGIANKAMADMVRYAAEFGMTPSARSRIEPHKLRDSTPDEDDPEQFFA